MSSNQNPLASLYLKGLILSAIAMASNAVAGNIEFKLEAPEDGQPYQGVANIRGWAVSTSGIDRIELYIDGVYKTDIPYGGKRGDVKTKFPDYPNALYSGYSMAFNYSALSHDQHQVTLKVIDNDGDTREKTTTISAIGFSRAYISDQDALDLSRANISANGNVLDITNLILDGRAYDVQLTWRPESQLYQFSTITPR